MKALEDLIIEKDNIAYERRMICDERVYQPTHLLKLVIPTLFADYWIGESDDYRYTCIIRGNTISEKYSTRDNMTMIVKETETVCFVEDEKVTTI